VALRVASSIGKRTLVVVHKEFLLTQWRDRIRQFLPDSTVTVIQGQKPMEADADFVIAMLQTLCLRLPCGSSGAAKLVATCGFAVIDEAHHMAARSFSELFFHLSVKRLLGLTATPTRKDGCTVMLHMFMGKHAFLLEDTHGNATQKPSVRYLTYNSPCLITRELAAGSVQKVKTELTQDAKRNAMLCEVLWSLAVQGRQIICLSDRVAHLTALLHLFRSSPSVVACESSLYVGGQKKAERERAESECDVIFATFAIASEGLDVPRLDTLVLASPAADITQSIGRIQRPCQNKQALLIVDVQDNTCQQFSRLNQCRRRIYARHCILEESSTQSRQNNVLLLDDDSLQSTPSEKPPEPPYSKRPRVEIPLEF